MCLLELCPPDFRPSEIKSACQGVEPTRATTHADFWQIDRQASSSDQILIWKDFMEKELKATNFF